MDIKILKERETPLLSRKRLTIMLEFKGATPPRLEIRDAVAKKLGVDKSLTIIKHIYSRFGSSKAKVIVHLYSKQEDLKNVEHEYVLKKHSEKTEQDATKPKPAEKKEAAA